MTADLVLDSKVFLGEGPLWDAENKHLWWINIFAGELYRFDPASGSNEKYEMGQQIGTVVLQESGGVAVALENGFYSFNPDSQELHPIVDPEPNKPGNRFNDGKCDPAGRFWAGTMEKVEEQATGSLYSLEGNGEWTCRETNISISNGITWTSDQKTMYFIDSPTRQVDAYDYDVATGQISNRRTAIQIPEGLGYPDGMSIDADDNLWVAMWSGWCVAKFDPRTGQLLQKVDLPVANVTACAFTGENLDELLITTARKGNTDEELEKQPHAGSLFHAKVDVTGTTIPKFRR